MSPRPWTQRTRRTDETLKWFPECLSSSSVSTSSVAGSLSIYLFIYSFSRYLWSPALCWVCFPEWGHQRGKDTAAFGDSHSSTLWGSAPPAHSLSPCQEAEARTSYPWRLVTLLSKLESKTNTGLPELLEPGFCFPGQEAGQQAAAPLCPLPPGAPRRAREISLRPLFRTVLLASGATQIKKQPALPSNIVLRGSSDAAVKYRF